MTEEYLVNMNFEEIKTSQNNVILFGSVGSGKTTLLNKLCEVDLLTKDDGFSCTRDVQFSVTPEGNLIIDFPGLNGVEEIVRHLLLQKKTLSMIPARMICLVIKLSFRYDDIVRSAYQMIRIFYENLENIVVIITNSENMTMVQGEEIKLILEKRCKVKPENVIFSTINKSPNILRKEINRIICTMNNIEKIVIKDRDLLNTVGVNGDFEVFEERQKFLNEFKTSLSKFKNEFDKAEDNSLKFALYYAFVAYKDDLIERFHTITDNKVTDTDTAIVEIITFTNEIFVEFDGFTKKVQNALKAENANYDNNQDNKRYKKCPFCGIIWFKVKGCNSMQCGRRTKLKDIFIGTFKNYIVRFFKGIFRISIRENRESLDIGKDCEVFGLTEEEKQQNRDRRGKCQIKPVGCGRNINWNEMEDVTDLINRQVKEIIVDFDSKTKEIIDRTHIDFFEK